MSFSGLYECWRGPMLLFKCVPAIVGWLWTLTVPSKAVEAAAAFTGLETDSLGSAFISPDHLLNERSVEIEGGSRTLLASRVLTDITDITMLHAKVVLPRTEGARLALKPGNLPGADRTQEDEAHPVPPPRSGKGRQRGLRAHLSTLVLFLVLCSWLFTSSSFKVTASQKTAPSTSPHQQQHKQQPKDQGSELDPSESQLDELEKLQPLATHLAEAVGIDESLAALWDFRSSVHRAKQAQRNPLIGSMSSSESSESSMKQALNEGVSALSRLYEVARQRGLSLAQKIRRINDFCDFSQEELQAMGGYLGPAFAGVLEFHLDGLGSSLDAFVKNVEETEKELKQLKGFERTQDRRLLAAVVADVEFIRAAHEALEKLRRFSIDLKSTAVRAVLSHYRREQTCMHRKCRDLLEEQQVVCKVERERQLSLSNGDTATLEKLDVVDEELRRGAHLLQTHREKLEQMIRKKDILSAEAARRKAEAVGQELKALLDAAASRLVGISGIAGAQEASHHGAVQRALHSMTSRASAEAATVADIVRSMQNEVKLHRTVAPPFLWMRHNSGRKNTETATFINPSVEALVTNWLQQVADNAEAVASQAASAAAGTVRDSSSSRAYESLLEASRATMLAEALNQEAELLGLRAQLIASLEFDMQVSNILAQRVAAAAGAAAGVEDQQQHWHVRLSPQEVLQVEGLLEQIKIAKEEAWSQRGLSALAVAAAAMKVASFGLISIVQGREKQ